VSGYYTERNDLEMKTLSFLNFNSIVRLEYFNFVWAILLNCIASMFGKSYLTQLVSQLVKKDSMLLSGFRKRLFLGLVGNSEDWVDVWVARQWWCRCRLSKLCVCNQGGVWLCTWHSLGFPIRELVSRRLCACNELLRYHVSLVGWYWTD